MALSRIAVLKSTGAGPNTGLRWSSKTVEDSLFYSLDISAFLQATGRTVTYATALPTFEGPAPIVASAMTVTSGVATVLLSGGEPASTQGVLFRFILDDGEILAREVTLDVEPMLMSGCYEGGSSLMVEIAHRSAAIAVLTNQVAALSNLAGTGVQSLRPSGTVQQGAPLIVSTTTVLVPSTVGTACVLGGSAGRYEVVNMSGADALVFPPLNGWIDQQLANAAVTLPAGQKAIFISVDGVSWIAT